jgi:hypothetical protein
LTINKKWKDYNLRKAEIIFAQTLNKNAPEKLYSWHAPEVESILIPLEDA